MTDHFRELFIGRRSWYGQVPLAFLTVDFAALERRIFEQSCRYRRHLRTQDAWRTDPTLIGRGLRIRPHTLCDAFSHTWGYPPASIDPDYRRKYFTLDSRR